MSAGFGIGIPVHGVGDGAPWIADQVEKRFGTQGSYLIDFYHACDYLSTAAKAIEDALQEEKAWMDAQKNRLKTNQAHIVVQELEAHLEPVSSPDNEAPVRQCHRYLSNRPNQLNYKDAIANDLAIGSGGIESAHRYVVQQRMKRGRMVACTKRGTHAGATTKPCKPKVELLLATNNSFQI